MSFILHRSSGQRTILSEVKGDKLRIGRGTDSDLRADDPIVALEHAEIELDAQGYTLSDKGSITGTYLNGRQIESSRLAKGDEIEIGSLRLMVQVADPTKALFLKVASIAMDQGPSSDGGVEEEVAPLIPGAVAPLKAPKIDYVKAYQLRKPFLSKSFVAFVFFTVGLFSLIAILKQGKETAFRPGSVSAAHATQGIADNCSACHAPFGFVPDQRCTQCHAVVPHQIRQVSHPECVECHSEHRELPALATVKDSTCTACHAALTVTGGGEPLYAKNVTTFGSDHPEFALTIDGPSGKKRVRLNEKEAARSDANPLLFNHAFHLKPGLLGENGRKVQLECKGCHALGAEGDIQRFTFAKNCQECHKLTFDARFPDREAPHAAPQVIFDDLQSLYSGIRQEMGTMSDEQRRLSIIRGGAPRTPTRDFRLQAFTVLDQVLNKCIICHQMEGRGTAAVIAQPKFRDSWFQHARFTHKDHRGYQCESCHISAAASRETADVLIPPRSTCLPCHGDRSAIQNAVFRQADQGSNKCITCHIYHERSKGMISKVSTGNMPVAAAGMPLTTPPGGSGPGGGGIPMPSLTTIVLGILGVAGLIALILFIKNKLENRGSDVYGSRPTAAAPTPPRAAAKPAAKPAMPDRTEPLAPSAPAAPSQATVMMDLRAEEAPQPTAMMQWHGSLLCTAGVLEGQRWVIEEDGVYIGRDATMSKIVVDDSRISRRHLWVGPRDGKVWVIDEGSTNGTFLNDPTSPRITEVQLKRGMVIIVGDSVASFTYQI